MLLQHKQLISSLLAVPSSQKVLVTKLQTQLVNSVDSQSPPDPSVLIALNLAEDQNSVVKEQLVQQIKQTIVDKNIKGRMSE